ncbi:MAG: signal recognition particle-docking protein FtsY, partial [Candidatus Verstraetearchaeota archaeon]|nr:signal recognition particle-docking protein FtsY [Candidatus Verstraetearchaeota archaeon]
GAAISISNVIKKPILFLGVGQAYKDLIPFDPNWVIENILAKSPKK